MSPHPILMSGAIGVLVRLDIAFRVVVLMSSILRPWQSLPTALRSESSMLSSGCWFEPGKRSRRPTVRSAACQGFVYSASVCWR